MSLHFDHPVGLAAGFDKNGVATLAWWAIGFSFVELGTVTPRPQPGHARPRMFRLPAHRALVNRMGFNNDGAQAVAARLADSRASGRWPPMPVGVSVGKNADTPLSAAAEDYAAAASALAPHVDFLTMNISSPNTAGLRDLQEHDTLGKLVRAVLAAARGRPVLVKVAPELEGDALAGACAACANAGASGIIATNTWSTRSSELPRRGAVVPYPFSEAGLRSLPEGGLSGRPLSEVSVRRVEQIRRALGAGPVIIGCGGIDSAQAARRMLTAGADLIQLYTGLVYNGPFLPARLSRAIAPRN